MTRRPSARRRPESLSRRPQLLMEPLEQRMLLSAATTVSPVITFDGTPGPAIDGAESRLTRGDDGVTLTVDTNSLDPGAYTVWWIIFNHPEYCVGECNGPDLRNPDVQGLVKFATGEVVGEDGVGHFVAELAEGDASGVDARHQGLPGADKGLIDSQKAEFHFVIRDHGPVSDDADMRHEQLTTFNGGCMTDMMPDGFACHDPQAGRHLPAHRIVLGDSNGDGQFDEADLIAVFQAGKYLTGQPATFAEGDWNDDGVFDTSDLIAAFQTGRYRLGATNARTARTAAVDEVIASRVAMSELLDLLWVPNQKRTRPMTGDEPFPQRAYLGL